MKLFQLPRDELGRLLSGNGVWLRTGPFSIKIRSRFPGVDHGLAELYGQFEVRASHESSADFEVSVTPPLNPAPLVATAGCF